MANIIEGNGKYGVFIKWSAGGTTTYLYKDKSVRDNALKRIKGEVTKSDKVKKIDK